MERSAELPASAVSSSDPGEWVALHGDALFRFAMLRLGDSELAEDAVQETLLAALAARDRFAGRSSERTWLIGILRNKVIDIIRGRQRMGVTPTEDEQPGVFRGGAWITRPTNWDDPTVAGVADGEFHALLRECIGQLPSPQREALCLRELDGLSSEEVADLLDVSRNNLWTLIHRAKLQLRARLEKHLKA